MPEGTPRKIAVDDAQLLRYSRHILLNELGIEGQEQLLASHARAAQVQRHRRTQATGTDHQRV